MPRSQESLAKVGEGMEKSASAMYGSTFCGLMAAMLLSWRNFTYIPNFCWLKLVQVQLLVVSKTARIRNLIWTTTSWRITSCLVGLHGE